MRILFTSSFLQNRSLVCSCPWDHHARRLSLRDDPESHLKEDCIILFHKNQTQSRYFLSAYHLFVAYFASKCEVFFSKISLIFATKIYQAFIKNRTQLSLDLNQLVLQAIKKRVGASLRKTLRCFNTVFWRPYQFFHSPYCKYSQCFTFKRCNKIQILVMDVWPSALIWKNQHNVKTVNVLTQIFGRLVGNVCLEISRCYSESNSRTLLCTP